MASLSEPALRLPLIVGVTFVAMFLARVSPLGPALFAAGFIVAYGLTLGDEVLGLALQPGGVANTTGFALPELAFIPPEEALVHFLLWLALVVAIPVALVVVGNLLTGRDPALLLRGALAARLGAAARVCAGEPGAGRALEALAREGTGGLLALHRMSRPPRGRASDWALIDAVGRLCLVLLAGLRLPAPWRGSMEAAAGACREAEGAVRQGGTLAVAVGRQGADAGAVAAGPLGRELWRVLGAIRAALNVAPGAPGMVAAGDAGAEPHRLLVADAFSNPEHVRFALKVTLAMMICYAVQDLTAWPGIHTCIITCFFVSLGTVGETVHKAALRIVGCLIGGGLGIGAILVLMPVMTDLGQLLVLVAAVTFLAGWIGSGSERSAYAGWQIGLAFYIAVLQGVGPTLDMATARDRIVGILIGDLVVSVIFIAIWPVGVGQVVRAALGRAMEQLALLMALPTRVDSAAEGAERGLRRGFGAAVAQARDVLVNDRYEAGLRRADGRRPIDRAVVLEVQALLVPVAAVLDLGGDTAWRDLPGAVREAVVAHHRALADWFRRCAVWIRSGAGAAEVAASLPLPPELDAAVASGPAGEHLAARVEWYWLLHRDIRAILDQVVVEPRPGVAPRVAEAALAAT
jgi:multidrug resistance protein MdtO